MNENITVNGHNVKIGDLFEMSWGYDQTNVDYFQVVRVSDKGVWVREIGAKTVEGTAGFMCSNVQPVKDKFLCVGNWCGQSNQPTFRRIQFSTWDKNLPPQPYFNFKGRYFARMTTETQETYCSWYA